MKRNLPVQEALRAVLDATPVMAAETVPASDALGRILAETIVSERTVPPADCSAMDGYCVLLDDLAGASRERPVELEIAMEVPAGRTPERALRHGEAARIFTGGAIPQGGQAVVMQEDCERRGDRVKVFVEPRARDHIRPAGEDLDVGDQLMAPGEAIRPPHMGVLASIGRSLVAVHQRPRVALLSGGDELVEPDRTLGVGQIHSSNAYTLAAQCREAGAAPMTLGIARDRIEDIEAHVRAGLGADVLISSAGVSVGDHDHVRDVLESVGFKLDFWGVQMKPGHPLVFGVLERTGTLVFGLPGNPVSASVTFEIFVRPALRKMSGQRALFRETITARLDERLEKKAGRMHFVRVHLTRDAAGEWVATSTGNQSSGVLRSLLVANGLLVFPTAATVLEAGDPVIVQVIDPGVHDRFDRGY